MKFAPYLFLLLALTNCGVGGLRHRHEDNEQVRALQEASVARYGERPIAGQSIDGFSKNKVGLIAVEGGEFPVGRAVPISEDGYYLTAWHVVADAKFQLKETTVDGKRIRVDHYPGKIVWHNAPADLAIVKFGFRPSAFFKAQVAPLEEGEAVFSGANGRNSGTLLTKKNSTGIYDLGESLRTATGNGSFRTAGEITGVGALDGQPSRIIYESTLIGRRGMSGGPVVNRTGHLVGIITGMQAKLFSGTKTSFSMIDAKALFAIVEADRGGR
jgi:S1-C subfamily serine protease